MMGHGSETDEGWFPAYVGWVYVEDGQPDWDSYTTDPPKLYAECHECHDLYHQTRPDRIYCSAGCASRARQRRYRARVKEARKGRQDHHGAAA